MKFAPVSWTPLRLGTRDRRCRSVTLRTRRSCGVGWWRWSGSGRARASWRSSSSRPSSASAKQAERDSGKRRDGLTRAEKEELGRLRSRPDLRVRERSPGQAPGGHDVPRARGLPERVLRVVAATGVGARAKGQCPLATDPDPPVRPSPETRTTWRSEWNSNFRHSRCGESEANPHRQPWQQR
jgi:hypothetical protein